MSVRSDDNSRNGSKYMSARKSNFIQFEEV